MNRIKLLFALGATAAALAGTACNSRAPSRELRTASSGQALTTAMVMRVELPPAVLPGDPLSLAVSFRDSAGQLLNVSDKVTVGLASKAGGTLIKGTTTVAAVSGTARFSDLTIAQTGSYQLLLTSPRASPVTSAPFAVTWSTDELEVAGSATNDTPSGAEAISPNVPLFGTLGPGDVDMYRFHARAGQILSVASHATRLDLGNWDTSLRLRLIAPDGTTELARSGAFGGNSPSADTGFAGLRIPAEGDYYLACDADRRGFLTGRYAVLLRLLSLPPLLQLESEPAGATGQNDTPATAQTLLPGVLYGSSDVVAAGAAPFSDDFKIAIVAPTRVHLDLTAVRNGSAWADTPWIPRLELQDSAGNVLWGSDGSAYSDPAVDYVVTVPGTYYVRVATASGAAASGTTPYFLTWLPLPYAALLEAAGNTTAAAAMPMGYGSEIAGSFNAPGDHYFSFTGAAGDAVRLWVEDQTQLQGASLLLNPAAGSDAVLLAADGATALASASLSPQAGQGASNVRQTILPATGSYFVRVRSAAPGSFGLRLDRISSSSRETEPNNAAAQGNPIDAGGLVSGTIAPAGDKDHFTVHAVAGQLVSLSLYAGAGGIANSLTDWGSALLPALEIRDPQGNLLSATTADRKGEVNVAQSLLRPEAMVEASFRAAAEGNYDVTVSDADGQGGANFFYALRVWKNQ
ncbi:MAG TPA: PPC domain-containing protein [Myxococcales bacterium]|nr:PPC domain-containing protein [Myxococcales bacterium]